MATDVRRSGKVLIVSASVGAGHDGAAAELARRLEHHGVTVDRRDFLDLLPLGLGPGMRSSYRLTLRVAPWSWEWALGRAHRGSGLGSSATRLSALAGPAIRRAARDADLVVSTYPLASQALGWLRATGRLAVPAVTFLTDMSVHPLWVHPGVDLHLALHEIAAGQATALGARARVVTPAVGPAFVPATGARDELRARFDLPAGPLALVVAGSWGVGQIEQAVSDIAGTGLATPVVACGRNDPLRDRIARSAAGIPLGWISDMPSLINACDVVVQNAGGLTSLEALATGTPVLTYRCLVGHGRTNADALDRAGWARWVTDAADLPGALAGALSAARGAHPFAGTDPVDELLAFVDRTPAVVAG